MTAKVQAPMLFGKRMRPSNDFDDSWEFGLPESDITRVFVWEFPRGEFRCRVGAAYANYLSGHHQDPQAAANDAERYLRRLHTALGKVIGP